MKKRAKTALRTVVPLAFGILILWLLYRNMDFGALMETLRGDANYWIILLSCLFGTAGNTFRGLRWHLLNRTLPDGHKARSINSLLTTHGNYAVNMALPRLGEVWRCAAMGQYSGLSFSSLFGTLLVDRGSDVVVSGSLVLLAAIVNFEFFRNFFMDSPALVDSLQGMLQSPWFYIALIAIALLAIVGWRLVRGSKAGVRLKESLHQIGQGLRTVAQMEQKGLFYLYTLLIWLSYYLQFYITFYAFSFTAHLDPGVGLLTFLMTSIAVAAPVQAGMGAWHFMVIYTLRVFGVDQTDASSFALIVHTLQTLWTTLMGLLGIALLPIVNKKRVKVRCEK